MLTIVSMMFACSNDDQSNNNTNNGSNNTTNNTSNGSTGSNTGTTSASTNNSTNRIDLCATINCGNGEPTCEANIAISFDTDTSCDPDVGKCIPGTEIRTDCEATQKVCQVYGCVDLCENLTCDPPEDFCTDNVATSYSGNGTCAFLDGSCDYAAVEFVTDCTLTDQGCVDGACVSLPAVPPTPGDVVITEILKYPSSRADDADWFEIKNVTNAPILLNDITVKDNERFSHLITATTDIVVNPGQYFVLGGSTDMNLNGGVQVDYAWGGDFPLSSLDEITLETAAGVVVDTVTYNAPLGYQLGVTTQVGNQHDLLSVDNDDTQLWCAGRTGFGAGDLGTPGTANEDCVPPSALTVYEIQDKTQANHPTLNSLVEVKGVVISAVNGSRIWVQETAGGEYSGVYVRANGNIPTLNIGDTIDLIGQYQESQLSGTTIFATNIAVVSTPGTSPEPEILNARIFSSADEAEKWEGVLIQINETGVTEASGQGETVFGRFRTDDILFPHTPPAVCTFFESIVGPLDLGLGKYRIQPRSVLDMIVSATPVVDQRNDVETTVDILGTVDGYSPKVLCVQRTKDVVYTNLDPNLSHDANRRDPSKVDPNNLTTQVYVPLLAPNANHRATSGQIIGTRHYRSTLYPSMEGAIIFLP